MSTILDQLLSAAQKAMKNSYAPHSSFNVGSALLTQAGNLFSGCNVENHSFGLTLCAETSAIANMISQEGAQKIDHILVLSSAKIATHPCGACLQRLIEFSHAKTRLYLAHGKDYETVNKYDLQSFLPFNFLLPPEEHR